MRWEMGLLLMLTSGVLPILQGEINSDLADFQGNWQLVGGETKGAPLPEILIKATDLQWKIRGGTIETRARSMHTTFDEKTGKVESQKAEEFERSTFKVDASKKPKQIDLASQKTGKAILGIYELQGDELKICIAPDGKTRPSEFKTAPDSEAAVLVLKRIKQ
jgi:uncharacterized protein (TIGR03067 family)